ncbi:MAG: Stk1 family PASTA domain-containing Ser/Thr kinase [Selenomonadaceae bacterium]|nr:Stk1 family PASTA domain-containing Ser/Thr kinase [Selenomonadaceae bacterium]
MVQRVLDQRYELQELIGSGGMADVYRAQDKVLNRSVAVKILHEQFRRDEEFIGKFHQEAQAAARLSHPNIVNIFDVGISGDDHYIVMEYVPGDTLKTMIQEKGHLPVEDALRIAREISDALAMAHANNIVHCDIKPHNILMMPDGHAKIADFGIARAVTESTMTYSGNVIGSVHYFSPEQAKGTYITPKSDVYSLGVVLYEMLTGHLPFTGENPVSIAMKHLQEDPVPVRQYNPDIAPVVEAVVMKAMSKDPAMRPDSAEFSRDLQSAEYMLHGNAAMSAPDPYATQVLPQVQEVSPGPSRRMSKAPMEEPEKKDAFWKSKLFMAGLVVVLVMGFCVGAFMSFGKFWSVEEVKVPDVVGKQMALARQILEDQHLRVNVVEVYDASVPAGQVVSQSPEAGATVKSERLVTINVSKGGEDMEMPDVKGLSRSSAENRLTKMGLNIGSIYEKYSDEEAGTVIFTDPPIGSKISKGTTVDLTISKGQKTKKVSVPDVTGASLESAKQSITSRNLRVGSITKQPSKQAEGTIVSQSPSGGEVEEGTSIQLVVAEPESVKPSPEKEGKSEGPAAPSETPDAKVPGKGNEGGKGR